MLLIVFELAGTTSRYAHPSRERLREAVEVVVVGLGPACSPSLHESAPSCLEMHPLLPLL